MEDLVTALTTSAGTIKTDFMSTATALLPVALAIAGVGIAVSLGWKFFKKLTK